MRSSLPVVANAMILSGDWISDKERFLRKPSLVRASLFRNGREQGQIRDTHAERRPTPMTWKSHSSCSSSLSASPRSPFIAASPRSISVSPTLNMPSVSRKNVPKFTAAPPSSDLAAQTRNKHTQDLESGLWRGRRGDFVRDDPGHQNKNEDELGPGVAPKKSTMDFFHSRYVTSALSAVSGALWDAPSTISIQPVPLPRFSSTPPPRIRSWKTSRNSIPYPDMFDFSMYERRTSHIEPDPSYESDLGLTHQNLKRSEQYFASPTKGLRQDRDTDGFRNSTYSFTTSPSIGLTNAATQPDLDAISPLRVVKRVAFDLPTSRLPTKRSLILTQLLQQEATSTTIDISLDEDSIALSIQSLTREGPLKMGCADLDLSRCEWTTEEFMRIFDVGSSRYPRI